MKTTLRRVNSSISCFTLVEDTANGYTLGLAREDKPNPSSTPEETTLLPLGLWGVVVHTPFSVKTIHILAEDQKAAEGQAGCFVPDKVALADCTFHATRIPLGIRGWGHSTV